MSARLKGKVILISGAGRGIGKAVALAYAQESAAVCCLARTRADVEATSAEIIKRGGTAIAVAADVRNVEDVEAAFERTAKEFGGIDIVVINAGVNLSSQPVEHSNVQAWKETLETNLFGAYACARTAIPHLKRRGGGKIITIGSGLGHRGTPNRSAYACSKAALWMLTRVLAQELAEYKISVNELVPGPVRTALTQGQPLALGDTEWIKGAEDVVPLAIFLAEQPDIGPTAQSFSLMRRDG